MRDKCHGFEVRSRPRDYKISTDPGSRNSIFSIYLDGFRTYEKYKYVSFCALVVAMSYRFSSNLAEESLFEIVWKSLLVIRILLSPLIGGGGIFHKILVIDCKEVLLEYCKFLFLFKDIAEKV